MLQSLSGNRYDGAKADLWSCGVMLYTMLVGGYPFCAAKPSAHDDPAAVAARVTSGQWAVPCGTHLSKPCVDLLTRLLMRDPAARISMRELQAHPWFVESLPEDALRMNEQLLAGASAQQRVHGARQHEPRVREVLKVAMRKRERLIGGSLEAATERAVDDEVGMRGGHAQHVLDVHEGVATAVV
eukprot:359724-Chlamydomonas_euryale.AAC.2